MLFIAFGEQGDNPPAPYVSEKFRYLASVTA